MQLRALVLLLPVFVFACTGSRSFPLTDLDGVTRIEVRNPLGADSAHVISDPERVRRAVSVVRAHQSGWEQSWHTLPAGTVAAVFYRDTVVLGVLWLGPTYVVARGREGPRIRSAAPDELARLAGALELPVKVIQVPLRGAT
jgi:hypothetical protein